MKRLGYTQDQISHLIFDAGIEYNREYCGDQPEITFHKVYWDWFVNEWTRAEASFMAKATLLPSLTSRAEQWFLNGQPLTQSEMKEAIIYYMGNWFRGRYPNSVVIHTTHKNMIHKLCKKKGQ